MADIHEYFTEKVEIEKILIDPQGKNLLLVYYPTDLDDTRYDNLLKSMEDIQSALAKWVSDPNQPIFMLAIPDDCAIGLEKLADGQQTKER